VLAIRRDALPESWPPEKREREMQVPEWLITMVYTCLKKKPENRFSNGSELHDFIIFQATRTFATDKNATPVFAAINNDTEKDQLKQQVSQYRQQVASLQKEVQDLKASNQRTQQPAFMQQATTEYQPTTTSSSGVSRTAFVILLLLTIGLATYSAYSFLSSKRGNDTSTTSTITDSSNFPDTSASTTVINPNDDQSVVEQKQKLEVERQKRIDSLRAVQRAKDLAKQKTDSTDNATAAENQTADNTDQPETEQKNDKAVAQYMVISKAYFYSSPDPATRRNAFVVPSNNAIVSALDEQNDFVYVVFTNTNGQKSKGWLSKQDLQRINE